MWTQTAHCAVVSSLTYFCWFGNVSVYMVKISDTFWSTAYPTETNSEANSFNAEVWHYPIFAIWFWRQNCRIAWKPVLRFAHFLSKADGTHKLLVGRLGHIFLQGLILWTMQSNSSIKETNTCSFKTLKQLWKLFLMISKIIKWCCHRKKIVHKLQKCT